MPTLQNQSQAVKQWQQCTKMCFEPGLGNQDSPSLHYCVLFSNFQEGLLQYYNIKVVPAQTIKVYRGAGNAPLINNVGPDRLLYSSGEIPSRLSIGWENVWAPEPVWTVWKKVICP